MSESEVHTPDTTDSSREEGKYLARLSLNSIPSIDRSEDESSSPSSSQLPNLAHTPPPPQPVYNLSSLAHTPPPHDLIPNQGFPNISHTPPPPPAPQSASEARAASRQSSSPRPSSRIANDGLADTYATLHGSSDPPTPDTRVSHYPLGFKRSSVDGVGLDSMGYEALRGSPPIQNVYGAIGGLYNSSHPSSGIYSGSASLGSIYGCSGPPPVPPPPLESLSFRDAQHRREHSLNSVHSVNSLREFYDKSSLNQFISTSPKLSNRDLEMNKMSSIYGSVASTGDYAGLREMFTDPVEEEGGERVVWEYHNVQLTRVPTYGFGIAVSGGRDNPHFRNGDPSVAISEVLKNGPAEGRLEVNDRLISANGISLENVDYARAVQILRDSGQTVHLVVKRRIVLPATPEPQTLKVTLTKNKKKDDFGIILGCRIYVKEIVNRTIADRDGGLREGDLLLKINNTSTENLSLKEAKKLVDGTKEKLQLLVRRENPGYSPQLSPDLPTKDGRSPDFSDSRPNYSTQNLYVQPPTRGSDPSYHRNPPFHDLDTKNNLRRYNNPNQVGFPTEGSLGFSFDELNPLSEDASPPPRPPLPRPEDYFTRNAQPPTPHADPNSPAKANGPPPPEPRFVSFKKEGSVGIRLTGGNEVGIFVTAVQPKSQAQLQGLIAGDKILKVNDMDMTGVTREEAVLYLMSLQEQIDLIVQTRISEYEQILSTQKGDLFYIRTHFHYDPSGKSELSFRSGDIFRVVDTLHNGVVGAWQVYRIGRNNQETQKGIIPNKARAEELATAQFNAAKKEQTQSESRSGFFKRRRNSRRSKSLGKDHWEDVVFADSVSKFPAYERVSLRHPGFVRPVVLFGPLSDVARDKLLKENPEKFASPRIYMKLTMPLPYYGYTSRHVIELDSSGEKPSGIIRLSAIREILERGKHAVLDITPNAVDRLNYAQFYPLVIFLRAESKQVVKELRSGIPKYVNRGRMSSKKLYDQSVKLEKLWSHVFTATISLTQPDMWFKKIKEIIDKQQSGPIWMSEAKPSEALTDDFLFPMTSRLSYASSPESDLETGPESRTPSKSPHRIRGSSPYSQHSDSRDSRGRLVKSSSDPSIAAQEETVSPNKPGPPPYTASPSRMPSKPIKNEASDDRRKSQGGDSKYGFSSPNSYGPEHGNQFPSRPPPPALGVGSPVINGIREESAKVDNVERSQGVGANVSNSYNQTPPYVTNRGNPPLSLPPITHNSPPPAKQSPHSPHSANHTRQSPFTNPLGRSPPKSSASNFHSHVMGGFQSSPPPLPVYNGVPNLNQVDQPDLPPKVNRSSKPSRLRSTSQDRSSGQDFGSGNDFSDNNYINTVQGSSLERQNKSPYDITGIPLGPNAHDDLKSRLHPKSPQDHYRYNRSSSQPPHYPTEDPYRNEYNKPMPPPKSANYKPVPPPKPKHYRGVGPEGGDMNQGWSYSDSARKGYDRGPYQNSNNGGLSDDYSGGFDSGQGSSLDRKYDTLGRSSYAKVNSSTVGRSGYYLNVPPPRDSNTLHGVSGRDLPNHDHRGSAFELYKKPADPRNPLMGGGQIQPGGPFTGPGMHQGFSNQLPTYMEQGSRYSMVDEGNHKVVASARGLFDHKGGTLASEETGVSVVIPPGAIAMGKKQEIYFKVCQDNSLIPPLDQEKGEKLLSPLVMCGPHGLQFKKPVELRLPHVASVSPNTWSFALKSSETPTGQNPTQWTNVSIGDQLNSPKANVTSPNCVSVLVDHF